MNREEDPPLWDLLGRSKGATPSPFFTRNVLRAVRNETPEKRNLIAWFRLRRLVPTLSAVAAVLITAFTLQALHHHRSSQRGIASAEVQDSDAAADLDVLISNDDDSDDASVL